MNVLLIGSGGREHTLAWKLAQSPLLDSLFIAPGNGGTEEYGENVNLSITDFEAIGKFCLKEDIGMVIVGPEEPLVLGIHDFFLENESLQHIPVIGPNKAGAQLEGSKAFSKQFMERHSIPTARYQNFTHGRLYESIAFLETLQPPFVLKADGLASGKGVLILDSKEQASIELESMLSGKSFGKAGTTVVIEEFLKGIELSVFILTDGNDYLILPEAKDYKRIGEKDTGPNTGGMGAISPVPFADLLFMKKVEDRIIKPTVEGLKKESISYKGFIFFGLINVNGDPWVIEYNCRLGDPETEVVIPRIQNDLLELFEAVGKGTLGQHTIQTSKQTAATVMMVAGGYPGDYKKGDTITGTGNTSNCLVFHAGTKFNSGTEVLVTNGGRIMAITSMAESLSKALMNSFENTEKINFDGKYFRRDIGQDLMQN